MAATFGLSEASTCASRLNRASRSESEREQFGQDLDRDLAIQFRIARAIDFAHASGAQSGEDFVRAEASAAVQAHRLRSAAQFDTTVIGIGGRSVATALTRNRPSDAGM